jgi:hypothetical protein
LLHAIQAATARFRPIRQNQIFGKIPDRVFFRFPHLLVYPSYRMQALHPITARIRRSATIFLWAAICLVNIARAAAAEPAADDGLKPILSYISTGWDTLTRSMTDCNTVVDPKLVEASVLYLPAGLHRDCFILQIVTWCRAGGSMRCTGGIVTSSFAA